MKPNPSAVPEGNKMMIAEVKALKERNKVLEVDNKLLRSRETVGPGVTTQEFNKVRNTLLNLLVAVENLREVTSPGQLPLKSAQLKTATEAAARIIRPLTSKELQEAVELNQLKVVINVDRAE